MTIVPTKQDSEVVQNTPTDNVVLPRIPDSETRVPKCENALSPAPVPETVEGSSSSEETVTDPSVFDPNSLFVQRSISSSDSGLESEDLTTPQASMFSGANKLPELKCVPYFSH